MELTTKPSLPSVTAIIGLYLADKAENTQRNIHRSIVLWGGFIQTEELSAGTNWDYLLLAKPYQAKAFVVYLRGWLKDAVIMGHSSNLRMLYRLFEDYGYECENPFERLRFKRGAALPDNPTEALSSSQARSMLDVSIQHGSRNRAVLSLLFGGLLRAQEVVNFKFGDMELVNENYELTLRDTKCARIEKVILPDWVGQAIGESRGDANDRDGLIGSKSSVTRIWDEAQNAAGIVGRFSPHSGRTTGINQLLDAGVTPNQVMKLSRHRSLNSLMRYVREREALIDPPGKKLKY